MKTKLFILMLFSLFLLIFVGCEKDEFDLEKSQNSENVLDDVEMKSIGDFVHSDDQIFDENILDSDFDEDVKTGSMYDILSNAYSIWSIPNYAFRCYDNFKWSYRHVKQPNGTSCSWSSYVICTGNVAAVSGKDYQVDQDQVYIVRDGCNWSKMITALRDYANSDDSYFVDARTIALKKSTTDYLSVFKQMMLLLYVNRTPFVTIVKSGKYTHYVTVYSIYWKRGLIGSKIYFTDSLDPDMGSFDQNVKSMNLLDFYCLMRDNANVYYNFLELLSS